MRTSVLPLIVSSVLALVLISSAFILAPRHTDAAGGEANPACLPVWHYPWPCGEPWPPPPATPITTGGTGCPCSESTNGFPTSGTCVAATVCLGNSTNGGGTGDPSKLLEALKSLLDALKGGGGGGGGAPPPSTGDMGSTTGFGSTGCTTYYQVTTPSSDPCAYYVPSITGGGIDNSNISTDLLNALNGINSNSSTNSSTNKNSASSTTSGGTTVSPGATTSMLYVSNVVGLAPGISGDIQLSSNGATLLVASQNTQKNSIVAGFYGSDVVSGGQPQGIVTSWCQVRPWAKNFLSGIIPPAFFDSLCLLRGYQVGNPPAPPAAAAKTQTVVKASATSAPVATSTGPYVPPEAEIWAAPATVSLAARTTVFWTSKGVTSCTETSPDGSFSQSSLSGGAATVPLSGPTTFTISCTAPDGSHVTNYVTVNLSI